MRTGKQNRWLTPARIRWLRRFAVIAAALFVLAAVSRGGYSAALPPPLSETDRECIASTHFPITVGVAKYKRPIYSDRLVGALRATTLFDRVEPLETVPRAEIIAHVNRSIYGTATIPIAYLLTFGIVPSIVVEEWGEVFSFTGRRKRRKELVRIEFAYEGPTTLGLAGQFIALTPSFTSRSPRETQRFHDAFAAAICAKTDEIRRAYANELDIQIQPPDLPNLDSAASHARVRGSNHRRLIRRP
jgi:hypothetical protein